MEVGRLERLQRILGKKTQSKRDTQSEIRQAIVPSLNITKLKESSLC